MAVPTAKLRHVIAKLQIDIVSIDPLLRAHEAEENSNAQMDAVASILIDIAFECDCAVDFVAHTAKAGSHEPGDSSRLRGASALRDGVRLLSTLTPMSTKEAESFGVSDRERRSLVRLDSAKHNFLPPPTATRWFELVEVKIGNATEQYPEGDYVQTVECWYPPATAGEPDPVIRDLILDQLEAGPAAGRRYSLRRNAQRAAWRVVKVFCSAQTSGQCQDVIVRWLRRGVLAEQSYRDPYSRKLEKGLVVVQRPLD
jgi:hypothetical protein